MHLPFSLLSLSLLVLAVALAFLLPRRNTPAAVPLRTMQPHRRTLPIRSPVGRITRQRLHAECHTQLAILGLKYQCLQGLAHLRHTRASQARRKAGSAAVSWASLAMGCKPEGDRRSNREYQERQPGAALHMGKILREDFLKPMNISAYTSSVELCVSPPTVNDVVRKKRGIAPEMAALPPSISRRPSGFGSICRMHWPRIRPGRSMLRSSRP